LDTIPVGDRILDTIPVGDRMFLGMQDFDFAQMLITFAQILPKSDQICPNLFNFFPKENC